MGSNKYRYIHTRMCMYTRIIPVHTNVCIFIFTCIYIQYASIPRCCTNKWGPINVDTNIHEYAYVHVSYTSIHMYTYSYLHLYTSSTHTYRDAAEINGVKYMQIHIYTYVHVSVSHVSYTCKKMYTYSYLHLYIYNTHTYRDAAQIDGVQWCSVLHTATHCCCNTLQHPVTPCNTLQYTVHIHTEMLHK